jgi:ABC-type amino acid transport substrate-binding protein
MRRLLIVILVLGLVGCANDDPPQPLEGFPDGVINIAIDPSIPPFASYDETGEIVGIDIDVGRNIGQRIGLPVVFSPMSVDALYDALLAEQVDVVIAVLPFEGWRTSHVRYTRGYFNNGLVLVTDDDALKSMRDLPGYALAYEFGSPADAHARQWLRRVAAFQTMPYETPAYALDAVRLGLADAALMDFVTARTLLRDVNTWEPHIEYVTQEGYVIAVRANAPEAFRLVDDALQVLLERRLMRQIIDFWL